MLKADGTECPHTLRTFTVRAAPGCVEAEASMFFEVGNYWLEVSYTTPVGYTAPDCGYELEYGPTGGAATSLVYATLPASPIILPATNAAYTVKLYAINCDGSRKLCYEDTAAPE